MNNLKTPATALPLFGGLCVIMKTPSSRPLKIVRESCEAKDQQQFRSDAKRDAKNRRERQKTAEAIQRAEDTQRMQETVRRNNAALRHLALFVNMVEIAKAKRLPVALGIAKRIASEPEAVKQWRQIREWLGKRPSSCCVVSIGKGAGGWWVIRWAVLGKPERDVFTEAAPLPLYLANKKGWKNSGVTMEAEAERLQDHYLLRNDGDEETLKTYTTEMFEVYRAALVMPKTTRTYRTDEAKNLIESCRMPVDPQASFPVAYNGDPRNSSGSGVALCRGVVKNGKVVSSEWICGNEETAEEEVLVDIEEGSDF